MKKKILHLLSSAVCLLSINTANSQITINRNDFPVATSEFRNTRYNATNFSSYQSPSTGANQTWDYTGMTKSTNTPRPYFVSNDPAFPNSYHYYRTFVVFQGFLIRSNFHSALDNQGYSIYAKEQFDTTYSITAITGGANDEINFPDAKILYVHRANSVKFPLNNNDTWQDSTILNTPYNLTVAAFGLNNTPGVNKITQYFTNSVVGHGTLVMNDSLGDESEAMEVLLVKSVQVSVDSFFLGGAPAPTALTNAFGLVQGDSTTFVQYSFYRKGYGDFVLSMFSVNENANSDLTSLFFNENAVVKKSTLSINTLEGSGDIKVYPNPIKAGGTLSINLNNNSKTPRAIRIFSIDGREVYNQQLVHTNSTYVSCQLPSNFAGISFVQLLDKEGAIISTERLIVVE